MVNTDQEFFGTEAVRSIVACGNHCKQHLLAHHLSTMDISDNIAIDNTDCVTLDCTGTVARDN